MNSVLQIFPPTHLSLEKMLIRLHVIFPICKVSLFEYVFILRWLSKTEVAFAFLALIVQH